MQQNHRDGLGRLTPHPFQEPIQSLPLKRLQPRSVVKRSLLDSDAPAAGNQRRDPGRGQTVQMGPVLAADLQNVLETFGRHQQDLGALALQQCIGADGKAMLNQSGGVPENSGQPLQDRLFRRRRRRGQLQGFRSGPPRQTTKSVKVPPVSTPTRSRDSGSPRPSITRSPDFVLAIEIRRRGRTLTPSPSSGSDLRRCYNTEDSGNLTSVPRGAFRPSAGIMKRLERLRRIYWTGALLAFSALLVIVVVLFLNPTSVGNPGFVSNLNLWSAVWAIYFIVALTLLFIFARNLIKLLFEHRSNRGRTRLKRKLVLTLTIISLFPALILFFVASGLINENLKLWFSSPSEDLLKAAEIIASTYYEEKKTVSMVAARALAGEIDWSRFTPGSALPGRLSELGFDGLMLVDRDRTIRYRQGDWAEASWDPALDQILDGREYYAVFNRADRNQSRFLDQGLAAVPARGADGAVLGGLVAGFVLPDSVTFHTREVRIASEKHRELMSQRQQFESSYFLIMAVTTLVVVVVFVWLGTYLARRITVPLEALAQGARELAEGNLDHRVEQKAVDELGILVDSFNRMADEIHHSRRRLEQANAELRETNERLDERRRYIETILENIATGVVSVDRNDVIRTANQAAMEMFGAGPEQILNQPLTSVLEPDVYADFQDMKNRVSLFSTDRRRVNFKRGLGQLPLTVTATTTNLPFKNGVEHVVVLDDLTELIRSGEIRRLAGGRQTAGSRDQESADPDSALGRSHPEPLPQDRENSPRDSRDPPVWRDLDGSDDFDHRRGGHTQDPGRGVFPFRTASHLPSRGGRPGQTRRTDSRPVRRGLEERRGEHPLRPQNQDRALGSGADPAGLRQPDRQLP